MKRLVMLTILDGFGLSDNKDSNAIYAAKKPNLDYLFKEYPNNTLNASGEAVGLPEGQMGNSEVGHLNLGAGRIVYQSLTRVNIAVRENTLIKNEVIQKAIKHAKENKSKVHIMGLLSDGGVHSHIKHILYLVEKIVEAGVKEVVVHAYLDGRDTPPKSALTYLKELQETIDKVGNSKIGIVSGRYYAMDRDRNWDRVQPAYEALVYNKAAVKNVFKGIEESYANGVTDEFVYPYIANLDSNINDGDSVIFANFRKDRAIEMSMALTNLSMTGIQNGKIFKDLFYASMMEYSENVKGEVILPDLVLENIYGEIIEKAGMTQLRIAETEKYAHVTFFFDGGEERTFKGADRILVPSPKEVPTYDLKPEMSAFEVCAKAEEAIASKKYDTIILNFANCDMVGHTTVFDATVKAVETVDACVGRLYEAVKKVGGVMVIIADHGNAEKLVEDGKPFSAHTLNPVPFIITDKSYKVRSGGNLGDVAPTLLELLGIKKPVEMTGKTLIYKNKEEF